MLGRFSIRTTEAPEPLPAEDIPIAPEAPRVLESISSVAAEPVPAVTSQNALLAEKLLDALKT